MLIERVSIECLLAEFVPTELMSVNCRLIERVPVECRLTECVLVKRVPTRFMSAQHMLAELEITINEAFNAMLRFDYNIRSSEYHNIRSG